METNQTSKNPAWELGIEPLSFPSYPKAIHRRSALSLTPAGLPSPQDWIRVNMDAAVSTSLTALAAIARDHAGKVIHVQTKMHKPCFPLQTEASALLWAVQQSSLKRLAPCHLQKWLQRMHWPTLLVCVSRLVHYHCLSNVLIIAFSFNRCSLSWVRRSGNSAAHIAARITMNSNLPLCLNNDNLPVALQSLLLQIVPMYIVPFNIYHWSF